MPMTEEANAKGDGGEQLFLFGKPFDKDVLDVIEKIASVAAERAARAAVHEILPLLGFNVEKASDQIETQKDQAFLRKLRRSAETRPAQLGLAVFSAGLSILGALTLLGLQYAFGILHPGK
jgi:hypothetical protein